MKCLSLWQPWASAVALGLKRIETRHWSTAFTGRLAIHAAKRWTRDERDTATMFASLYDGRLAVPPLGAIIATVRLIRCERTEAILSRGIGEMEHALGNYGPRRFGWLFDDVAMLPAPIPFRGLQGLFDVPDEVLDLPSTSLPL